MGRGRSLNFEERPKGSFDFAQDDTRRAGNDTLEKSKVKIVVAAQEDDPLKRKIPKMDKITYKVNGITYSSLEEVPAEYRHVFSVEKLAKMREKGQGSLFKINGVEYDSLEKVPAEYRKYFTQEFLEQAKKDPQNTINPKSGGIIVHTREYLPVEYLPAEERLLITPRFKERLYCISQISSFIINSILWFVSPNLILKSINPLVSLGASLVIGHFSYVFAVILVLPQKNLQPKVLPEATKESDKLKTAVVSGVASLFLNLSFYLVIAAIQTLGNSG